MFHTNRHNVSGWTRHETHHCHHGHIKHLMYIYHNVLTMVHWMYYMPFRVFCTLKITWSHSMKAVFLTNTPCSMYDSKPSRRCSLWCLTRFIHFCRFTSASGRCVVKSFSCDCFTCAFTHLLPPIVWWRCWWSTRRSLRQITAISLDASETPVHGTRFGCTMKSTTFTPVGW